MIKLRFNGTSIVNAGCFKKRFTMAFQMLLCGECYENVSYCTLFSVNVFVTLLTQWHLEYYCKALFETPCILVMLHRHLWADCWNSVGSLTFHKLLASTACYRDTFTSFFTYFMLFYSYFQLFLLFFSSRFISVQFQSYLPRCSDSQ
jgi:hypothetical protein